MLGIRLALAWGLHVARELAVAGVGMQQAALLESEVMHTGSVTQRLHHSLRPNRYLAAVVK